MNNVQNLSTIVSKINQAMVNQDVDVLLEQVSTYLSDSGLSASKGQLSSIPLQEGCESSSNTAANSNHLEKLFIEFARKRSELQLLIESDADLIEIRDADNLLCSVFEDIRQFKPKNPGDQERVIKFMLGLIDQYAEEDSVIKDLTSVVRKSCAYRT